jgi:hypothetical protein
MKIVDAAGATSLTSQVLSRRLAVTTRDVAESAPVQPV